MPHCKVSKTQLDCGGEKSTAFETIMHMGQVTHEVGHVTPDT